MSRIDRPTANFLKITELLDNVDRQTLCTIQRITDVNGQMLMAQLEENCMAHWRISATGFIDQNTGIFGKEQKTLVVMNGLLWRDGIRIAHTEYVTNIEVTTLKW